MRKKQDKPKRLDKKYRNYSPDAMIKAYEAVLRETPVKRAAKQFAVPVQTLRDRVKGRIDPNNFQSGGETVLTKEEEESLVDHVEGMAELGYGYSNIQLQQLAGELAHDMGKRERSKPLSHNWISGFLKRWEHRLTKLNPRKLDSQRARSSTPETVNLYYQNLQEIMTEYNLHDKPHLIFNIDETGLQPEHRPPSILASVNTKPQAVTSPRSTTTTLISCVNAVGNSLPPFFVFKGKRFNPDLLKGGCPGAHAVMSESGWSNSHIFQQYLQEHFLPYVSNGEGSSQPVLVTFDGHASHISTNLIKWAKEHNIILFVLPAHTSHLLQPLDVSIFGPFKSFYYSECALFMRQNMGTIITKYDICGLACKAYLKAFTPINIQAGFRKTGIYPFCADAVPKEKLFPAESFREEKPIEKVKAIKSGKGAVEEFLKLKTEKKGLEKQSQCETHVCSICNSKKLFKPKPGGTAITEDKFYNRLNEYETEKETHQSSKRERGTKGKGTKGKKGKTTKAKVNLEQQYSPKPSTSGINTKSKTNSTSVHSLTDTEDMEEDISEDDVCCVCNKASPPNLHKLPYLKIVNWAMCEKCCHWVHLAFCSKVTVVRRHSVFLCPHCDEQCL